MIDGPTIAALIAAAALVLNIVLSVRGGAWRIADRLAAMEKRITDRLTEHRSEIDRIVAEGRGDTDKKIDQAERRFGETVTAMQNKIHEFEKWTRDEFVRKKSHEVVLDRIDNAQRERDRQLHDRLNRLDEKLDAMSAAVRRGD